MTRKKLCLTVSCLIIAFCVVFAAFSLKDYGHRVPVEIGPYREALLTVMILLAAVFLGFAFHPVDCKTVCGTILIGLSAAWFLAEKLTAFQTPGSSLLITLENLMPLAVVIFGAGVAFWVGAFLPGSREILPLFETLELLLTLLLMFIVLQPVLSGGFYWDDAFFSVEGQVMRVNGTSVFERVWKEIVDYVRIGRINPFATFHFLVFYFIPDVRLYKLMLVVLTLVNGLLFYRFLRVWLKDHRSAALMLLIVPFCFQFRLYHDPLNSYYGLMQVMFCELMLSLTAYLRWIRGGKKKDMMLSLLFFAMGLMSYEMFFPLTALFIAAAWAEEKDLLRGIRRALPWIGLALLIFGLSMVLRRNITAETAYNGTTFSLDINAILRTFATQVGAAFPFSYRNAGNNAGFLGRTVLWSDVFNTSLPEFINAIQWQDVLGCFILICLFSRLPKEKKQFSGWVFLFGLLLWLLPGSVISLSTKYQLDLLPGLAYIPVHFSYFGIGIVIYEVLLLAEKLIRQEMFRLFLCGAGCAMLLLSMQDNRHIIAMLDDIFLYPRQTGEKAVQAGLLGKNTPDLVVSAVPYSLWEHGWILEPYQDKFYTLNARKAVNAIGVKDYADAFREEQPEWITPAEGTVVVTYGGDKEGGFAKSGTLTGTGIDYGENTLLSPIVSEAYFYVSGANRNGVTLIYQTRDAEWKQLDLEKAWIIQETPEGTLYKLQERRPVFFDSIGLRTY